MNIIYSSSMNGVSNTDLFTEQANRSRKAFMSEKIKGKIAVVGRRCYEFFSSCIYFKGAKELWVLSRYQRPISGAHRVMSFESLLEAQYREAVFEDLWLLGGDSLIRTVLVKEDESLYSREVRKAVNEVHLLTLGCYVPPKTNHDYDLDNSIIKFDRGRPFVKGSSRLLFKAVSSANYGLLTHTTLESLKG